MNKIVQILLFLISYVPLYVILLFKNINTDVYVEGTNEIVSILEILQINVIPLAFLILIILSITLYWIFFKLVTRVQGNEVYISDIKDKNLENLSYLATYILPFVGLKFDSWQNTLSTIALFYVLGHVYINTNLILTNPTLTFFGYSISNVTVGEKKESNYIVIHKDVIVENRKANLINLINNVYILDSEEERNEKGSNK